jgi:hypothetical protein
VYPSDACCQASYCSRSSLVTYVPTTVGPLVADLTLHFTDGIAPTRFWQDLVIPINGVGLGAQAQLSPSQLNFGTVVIGAESAPQSVSLQNTGQQPLTVSGSLIGVDFRLQGTLPATVAPGQTQVLNVVFRPGHNGSLSTAFSISSNSVQPPTPVVFLGVGVAQPLLVATPLSIAFGTTPVGSVSAKQVVVVRNQGAVPVHLGAITITGPDRLEFKVTRSTCAGATLPPEAQCEVELSFMPASAGAKQAALEIAFNGPTSRRSPAKAWRFRVSLRTSARSTSARSQSVRRPIP